MTRFKTIMVGLCLWAGLFSGAILGAESSRLGVVVVAHGARGGEWNTLVEGVAGRVDLPYPLEVAFLMDSPEGKTLQDAVTRLENQSVEKIVVVPFLVSSYSGHYEELRYYLGLRAEAPGHVHGGPLKTRARLVLTPALDNDAAIPEILLDYASEISRQPAQETVILVAHGPNEDEENEKWMKILKEFGEYLESKHSFKAVLGATLRDDAPAPVRDAATQQLRQMVTQAAQNGTVLVVPVLISKGLIQERIRERLEGLAYQMCDKGLAQDPRIAETLRRRILQQTAGPEQGLAAAGPASKK